MGIIFHRLNRARYEINSAASTVLQFSIPAGISVAFGFARLTNLRETVAAAFVCTVTACLSWVAGRALRTR
jgi:hypothetical protein